MTYYHGARSKALYFRLKDSDSGMVFRTYTIGDYMTLRPPEKAIDSQNTFTFSTCRPQAYKYTVISIDGEPIRQQNLYEKGSNRPQLKNSGYGEVSVVGGITEEEAKTPYETQEFHPIPSVPRGCRRSNSLVINDFLHRRRKHSRMAERTILVFMILRKILLNIPVQSNTDKLKTCVS